jgi:citrate synthase
LEPIAPDPRLGFSENFFQMCFGEVPDQSVVRAFDISMILYAEHSFNASTFAARVVISTLSDIYSAVTAGIGALKGPLHGGANEAVMSMMLEVGSPEAAESWLRQRLADKEKVMGFGHRVYKHGDSRVPTMKKALDDLAATKNGQVWLDIYEALERIMVEEKGIYPNLDFPTGPAYYLMGFDIPTFTPLFVISRITGWTAHIMEQLEHNALIRPLSHYNGPEQRSIR